jgi:asparagine synthase (glutamine-hydrolysing)
MRDIWGWIGSSTQDEQAAKAILAAMAGNSANLPYSNLNGHRSALAAPSNGSLAEEGDLMVAVSGRPRFLEPAKSGLSPAQSVLLLWRKYGRDLFAQISGTFALAVIDRRVNTLLLAVDRIGIQRMCFAPTAGGLVFGSSCDAVVRHPAVTREIDPQGIFNYLYAHMVPAPGTIYRGVEKLLPAQYALLQNGQLTRGFYWEAEWEDGDSANFELKSKELHALLEQCVHDALDAQPTGAFLSGGTDSSTISGMLTRVSGKPAETFSIGFEAEGFDEIEYARIAVRHFGAHPHEYYVTPDDVVRAIPLIAATYDEPFGNASAVPTYFCALKAKEAGIDVMLAGDGGDEIFGGNTRYAKQKIFEAYGRVPGILRKGLIEPLLMHTPGVDAFMPTRKLKSYAQQANIPLPDRLETYNYLNHDPLDEIFTPEFLRTVNPEQPADIQREVYFRTHAQSPINRMLHLDWKQTLADSDLVKVARMCEAAGVEVRYPLLDDRMVSFAAMLPPAYKVRGRQLRWFFKEALKDFLPREILTKSKHGFGLPFGLWMKAHPALFALAQDNLHAFRVRGYVRQEYMDRLIQAHQTEHATYYGVMIWVIMMLEQWLQHHDQHK